MVSSSSRVLLLVGIILVLGDFCLANFLHDDPYGEYPQPKRPPHRDHFVTAVSPRLGAVSVEINGDIFTTGGLSTLPEGWPASFAQIEELSKEYSTADVTVYSTEEKVWIYGIGGDLGKPWPSMESPRAFHVAQEYNNSIYVWGGGSDSIERYDADYNEWTNVSFWGEYPESRFAAASVLVDSQWFIFGGVEADGSTHSDLLIYEIENGTWFQVEGGHHGPNGRFGASLNYYNGPNSSLVLYGGTDPATGLPVNDLWLFNLDRYQWTLVETPTPSGATTLHAAVISGDELHIALGEAGSEWRDIWTFNFDSWSWSVRVHGRSSAAPPVQSGFSYVLIESTQEVYLFSGVRDTGVPGDTYALNAEFWILELSDLQWRGRRCYPSYTYDLQKMVCDIPAVDDCKICDSCTNEAPLQRHYAAKLRNKMVTKDFTGVLRQCPAIWRGPNEFVN